MSGQASIMPEETWALVVAVESYPQRPGLDLPGTFLDACKLVRWLRSPDVDVPPENILLLAQPLDANKGQSADLRGGRVQCEIDKPVTQEAVEEALKRFRNKPGMLVVFWSGHGIMTADEVRRPFLGNFSDADKHNLNVDSLQKHLRSAPYGYPREQALVFDICGTRFDELWHREALPDTAFPIKGSGAPSRCRQFVVFASEDGQDADHVTQERTSLFYRELQEILMAQAGWPPDLEEVHRLVVCRFKELNAAGMAGQVPIRYLWEAPSGRREEFDLVSNPRARASPIVAFQFMLVVALAMIGGLLVFLTHRADTINPHVAVKEIKGRLVPLGASDQDKEELKRVRFTVDETGDDATTNDRGRFTIHLSRGLQPGQTVTLLHDKTHYLILHPGFFGRIRVPPELEIMEVWIVKKGSKVILEDGMLDRVVLQVQSEVAARPTQSGMPPGVDWNAEDEKLAREAGFTVKEVQDRFRAWEKRASEDKTDPRRMALVAYRKEKFGQARKIFEELAERKEREAVRDRVSAGESAYAGGNTRRQSRTTARRPDFSIPCETGRCCGRCGSN